MDYYDFLQSSDQGPEEVGADSEEISSKSVSGNNNWAGMRTRGREGWGEISSGCFKLTVEFSMLFVQSFPSPPTRRGTSPKLANFL